MRRTPRAFLAPSGAGVVAKLGLGDRVLVQMGTLGKALGGFGAYVAGSRALRELLINRCRSFIFTTALPPAVMAMAIAALDLVQSEPERREALWDNCRRLATGLRALGFHIGESASPILPLIIGEAAKCMRFSEQLFERGVFAQGIRPPTVPEGTSRLRITLMATHTRAHIERALAVFTEVGATPMTTEHEKLKQLDHTYLWHPFTQMQEWMAEEPVIISRGDGHYLIDVQGKKYLDGVSSLWCNVHGHRKKEIDDAIKDQLDRIGHSTFLGLSHAPGIQLAEKLIGIAPPGLKRVFYSDSGATAVEIALKMAVQYWQLKGATERTLIASLAESYHGDTVGSMSMGYSETFHRYSQEPAVPRAAPHPAARVSLLPADERWGRARSGAQRRGAETFRK